MKRVSKPWIAFKVLAAGAIHPKKGFKFAFENGADFANVGMFDFQVREDALITRDIIVEIQRKGRARPWMV
jgi:NAD(P)H-dependent flavin oxidoreductase YrpB (nitropropane dioxygenase family)